MAVGMGEGPVPARVMIVGEAFGEEEERTGKPFVGASGKLLNSLLHEIGLMRSECYVTNLVNSRPLNNDISNWIAAKKKDVTSEHVALRDKYVKPIIVEGFTSLKREISLVKPSVIITLGNTSMWALTGSWGIMKWRGSILDFEGIPLIPCYHPAAILREWSWHNITLQDLRRAKRFLEGGIPLPKRRFILRPSFVTVEETLTSLHRRADSGPIWLDLDLETKRGHISCCGISWSRLDAICIPFTCDASHEGYWLEAEEVAIIYNLYRLLTHSNVRVRGQNLLYDFQYIHRWWLFLPTFGQDTMISFHVLFPGLRKSLDFQASMLCEHYVNWKPDKTSWKEGG